MNKLYRLYRHFFPTLTVVREAITKEDISNRMEFVTSSECKSVEKFFRHRIIERMETASDGNMSDRERLDAIAKKEELLDILLEWKNIRTDLRDDEEA